MTIDIVVLSNYLDIKRRTIKYWVKKGQIPYFRKGRHFIFKLEEIDNWIEQSREKTSKKGLFR